MNSMDWKGLAEITVAILLAAFAGGSLLRHEARKRLSIDLPFVRGYWIAVAAGAASFIAAMPTFINRTHEVIMAALMFALIGGAYSLVIWKFIGFRQERQPSYLQAFRMSVLPLLSTIGIWLICSLVWYGVLRK